MAEVAQHFQGIELCASNQRRSWATKQNYNEILNLYIVPRWGKVRLMDVRTVEVELWLKDLQSARREQALSNPTKQRIRNVFSCFFSHAQRYQFVPQGHNPIQLVRQSGKRKCLPEILTAAELHALWSNAKPRERALISLGLGNGLRISEAIGLKWMDLDLAGSTASVNKSMVKGRCGDTKTETSRKLVPLHPAQIIDLKAWLHETPYRKPSDWVFASHSMRGRQPYWPDMLRKRNLEPLAKKLGIRKKIGWHTFRRTYASLLAANGTDIKVVQELLRHANISTTMNLYAQAFTNDAREAQHKVIEMVRNVPVASLTAGQQGPGKLIVH